MAYEELDKRIINRIIELYQQKSLDLRKESKLASALSKSLLCKNFYKY